jgi:hypothetical protein
MRNGFLATLLLFSYLATYAQQPEKRADKGLQHIKPQQKNKSFPAFGNSPLVRVVPDTTSKKLRELLKFYKDRGALLTGSFSHNTSQGKVFILPPDKMSCLAPDMKQVIPMPGSYGPFPKSHIPNATPEKPVLPKKPEGNK